MLIPTVPYLEAWEWVKTHAHVTAFFEDVFCGFWKGYFYFVYVTRKYTGQKIYHFKFLKCTVGWYQVHSQSYVVTEMHFQNFSWSTPKEMLHPLNNCFPSPHPPNSRCPLFLLYCVCQLQRSHVNGILPYLPTCDWEISRRMSSELIHAAPYIRNHLFLRMTIISLYLLCTFGVHWICHELSPWWLTVSLQIVRTDMSAAVMLFSLWTQCLVDMVKLELEHRL